MFYIELVSFINILFMLVIFSYSFFQLVSFFNWSCVFSVYYSVCLVFWCSFILFTLFSNVLLKSTFSFGVFFSFVLFSDVLFLFSNALFKLVFSFHVFSNFLLWWSCFPMWFWLQYYFYNVLLNGPKRWCAKQTTHTLFNVDCTGICFSMDSALWAFMIMEC